MLYQAGYAITDIAALKALTTANLVNGYTRWVISKNTWYGWDANSTTLANDDSIVALTSAPTNGRFFKQLSAVSLDIAQQFTQTQGNTTVVLTDAISVAVDASLSNKFSVTLGGNRTLANPTLLKDATYIFTIKQDITGNRTLAYGTSFKFPGGVLPVLSAAPNAIDELYCNSDGTVLRCVLNKDYK